MDSLYLSTYFNFLRPWALSIIPFFHLVYLVSSQNKRVTLSNWGGVNPWPPSPLNFIAHLEQAKRKAATAPGATHRMLWHAEFEILQVVGELQRYGACLRERRSELESIDQETFNNITNLPWSNLDEEFVAVPLQSPKLERNTPSPWTQSCHARSSSLFHKLV